MRSDEIQLTGVLVSSISKKNVEPMAAFLRHSAGRNPSELGPDLTTHGPGNMHSYA